jgi:hypothetical protein
MYPLSLLQGVRNWVSSWQYLRNSATKSTEVIATFRRATYILSWICLVSRLRSRNLSYGPLRSYVHRNSKHLNPLVLSFFPQLPAAPLAPVPPVRPAPLPGAAPADAPLPRRLLPHPGRPPLLVRAPRRPAGARLPPPLQPRCGRRLHGHVQG